MANNQYTNRVDVMRGNATETLIDITDTTAVAADVAQGKYFYLASGEKVAGTSSGGGGGGGALVCNVTINSLADPPTATLDKKASEILAALNDGMVVWVKTEFDDPESVTSLIVSHGITDSGRYEFDDTDKSYYADTENDYPVSLIS